jgi:nucleoside 2-deoxyribosyltransferase
MIHIYLSASISNSLNNAHLMAMFQEPEFLVHLPQKIVPRDLDHTRFPLDVYQQCIEMMEDSHVGLVLLDAFGRDCAWECGWYSARPDKALIAYVEASSLFLRDWMVKGGLDGLITPNPRLYQAALENPILSQKKLQLIPGPEALPAALADMYQQWV